MADERKQIFTIRNELNAPGKVDFIYSFNFGFFNPARQSSEMLHSRSVPTLLQQE